MEKTVDWNVVQKMILTPSTRRVDHRRSLAAHKVLYWSILKESWLEGTRRQEKVLKQQGWLQPWEEGQEKSIKKTSWGLNWSCQCIKTHQEQTSEQTVASLSCHVLLLVHCVLSSQKSLQHRPGDFEALLASISFQALWTCRFLFFFLHNLAPVQRFKTTTGCFTDCDFTVLDWSVSSPDLPESCYQSNPGFSNTSAVPQAAHLHDTPHLDSSLWWRSPNWVVSVWKRTFLYCKDFLNSNNINIPVRVWDTELKNWFCWDISHHHWKLKPKMHEIFHFMHNEL